MKLNRELCALRRELSQLCWQDDSCWGDAYNLFGIVHFNSHERSEFTSIFTSSFTSETSVYYYISNSHVPPSSKSFTTASKPEPPLRLGLGMVSMSNTTVMTPPL